jgi:hypothetical protein
MAKEKNKQKKVRPMLDPISGSDTLAINPCVKGMAMFIDGFIKALTNCGDISIDDKMEKIAETYCHDKKSKKRN